MILSRKLDTGHFLPLESQVRQWKKANRKMGWKISREEFNILKSFLPILPNAAHPDYGGITLCYGFGDDGENGSDAVLSGFEAWRFTLKNRWRKTWQCQYIKFNAPDYIRLRPGAPTRPKGFYLAHIYLPMHVQRTTVSSFRKGLAPDRTGLGPEGIQMLCITNPHLAGQMNENRLPFISLADYDVAPYGYFDFFDAMQMFCSIDTLGLGIGNVDRDYPLFGMSEMDADFINGLSEIL